MLGVTMPNHNEPNINSQDDSTYSSTKGLGVVACVDPLDFMSFMSQVSQATLGAIVAIGDPLDQFIPLEKISYYATIQFAIICN